MASVLDDGDTDDKLNMDFFATSTSLKTLFTKEHVESVLRSLSDTGECMDLPLAENIS
jgi:hypothetical protein